MDTKINNNIQIILAEDNQISAALTINAIRKCNVENEIIHLADGAAVLDFIFKSPEFLANQSFTQPKIFLLDINMPKVNGMEVLQQLKQHKQTQRFPVIMFSSSDLEADIQQCYDLGTNSYMVKPVDFSMFVTVIKQMCLYWLTLNKIAEY